MCYALLIWLVGRFGKQSDSVSDYDAEVCGVVTLVDRLCYSCAATENLANYVNYIRSALKKK